jgi:hypothetical protein
MCADRPDAASQQPQVVCASRPLLVQALRPHRRRLVFPSHTVSLNRLDPGLPKPAIHSLPILTYLAVCTGTLMACIQVAFRWFRERFLTSSLEDEQLCANPSLSSVAIRAQMKSASVLQTMIDDLCLCAVTLAMSASLLRVKMSSAGWRILQPTPPPPSTSRPPTPTNILCCSTYTGKPANDLLTVYIIRVHPRPGMPRTQRSTHPP